MRARGRHQTPELALDLIEDFLSGVRRSAEPTRVLATVLFSLLCVLGLMVTFVGVFFRGPGYSLVTPFLPFFDNFTNGLHFAL